MEAHFHLISTFSPYYLNTSNSCLFFHVTYMTLKYRKVLYSNSDVKKVTMLPKFI